MWQRGLEIIYGCKVLRSSWLVSVYWYRCLYVCPLACLKKTSKLHQILCMCCLWPWFGPSLTTMQYDDYVWYFVNTPVPSVNYFDGLDCCILYCILFVFMLALCVSVSLPNFRWIKIYMICYIFPVLWITSCLHKRASHRRRECRILKITHQDVGKVWYPWQVVFVIILDAELLRLFSRIA